MRQRDAPEFAEMLDRIRIGSPTDADIEALESRMISKLKRPGLPDLSM